MNRWMVDKMGGTAGWVTRWDDYGTCHHVPLESAHEAIESARKLIQTARDHGEHTSPEHLITIIQVDDSGDYIPDSDEFHLVS